MPKIETTLTAWKFGNTMLWHNLSTALILSSLPTVAMLPQIFHASSPWLDTCSNSRSGCHNKLQNCTPKPPKAPNPAPSIIVPQDAQQEMFAPETTEKRSPWSSHQCRTAFHIQLNIGRWCVIPCQKGEIRVKTAHSPPILFFARSLWVFQARLGRTLYQRKAFSLRHLPRPHSNLAKREHGRSTSPKGFCEISRISKPKKSTVIFLLVGKRLETDSIESSPIFEKKILWGDTSTMTSWIQLVLNLGDGWWWLNQAVWKIMLVKLDHFHKDRGENRKYVKPPPSDPFLPSSFMLYKSATAKELDFWKLPWHAYLQDTPSQLASLWKKMQGHKGPTTKPCWIWDAKEAFKQIYGSSNTATCLSAISRRFRSISFSWRRIWRLCCPSSWRFKSSLIIDACSATWSWRALLAEFAL